MAGYTGAPGPSEVSQWQSQIVKPGAVVSQTTNPSAPGASPAAIELYNMAPAARKQLAIALKNAGYRVPTTGAYSDSLLSAFSKASLAAQTQAQMLGMPYNSTMFSTYLAQETQARAATGAGGAGGPKSGKNIQTRISTETDAKALINAVIRDQLGRDASKEEIAKYTTALQTAQKNAPVTTTYTTKGGVTTSKTTGGINEQQYLLDKISGGDEAKANRALGFYETFMNALGRG